MSDHLSGTHVSMRLAQPTRDYGSANGTGRRAASLQPYG